MSAPYLYHLAASTRSTSTMLRPYSKLIPRVRKNSASPDRDTDANQDSDSGIERSTPTPLDRRYPTANLALRTPCSAAARNHVYISSQSLGMRNPVEYSEASVAWASALPSSAACFRWSM